MDITTHEGSYRWSAPPPAGAPKLRRYTAYVRFDEGTDFVSVEEIDVDATTHGDAWSLAAAALERDYEAGGSIVSVEERFGWYS